jgi:hypothetical protein
MNRVRVAASVLVLAVGVAACAAPHETPRPTTTTSARPVIEDQHLRAVRMSTGRALTHVQPDTASQVLCQVLERAEWEQVLGGRVGRAPLELPNAGCLVTTEQGDVRLQLREMERALDAETTVAGRPAVAYPDRPGGRVLYVLALTDEAASPSALRTLEVEATDDVAHEVLDAVVPLLAKEGDALPAIDDRGDVEYVVTPLTGGRQFGDLPQPVQGLQLCTVLLEGEDFRIAATDVGVAASGACVLTIAGGRLSVEITSARRRTMVDSVGGRPAEVRGDRVVVQLRDDANLFLDITGPDAAVIAEKLAPLLG